VSAFFWRTRSCCQSTLFSLFVNRTSDFLSLFFLRLSGALPRRGVELVSDHWLQLTFPAPCFESGEPQSLLDVAFRACYSFALRDTQDSAEDRLFFSSLRYRDRFPPAS